MLPLVTATLAKCKTSKKNKTESVRMERMSVASTVPDCLTVVPILQLLFISLGPQQLKRINHPLCYLTDQKKYWRLEVLLWSKSINSLIFFTQSISHFAKEQIRAQNANAISILAVSGESFTQAKRKVDPCNSLIKHCKIMFGAREDIGKNAVWRKTPLAFKTL